MSDVDDAIRDELARLVRPADTDVVMAAVAARRAVTGPERGTSWLVAAAVIAVLGLAGLGFASSRSGEPGTTASAGGSDRTSRELPAAPDGSAAGTASSPSTATDGTTSPGDAVPADQASVEAAALCSGPGAEFAAQYDPAATLVRTHSTTEARFDDWAAARHGPDGPQRGPVDRTPSDTTSSSTVPGDAEVAIPSEDASVEQTSGVGLALCYYDGDFRSFPSPGGTPAYNRLSLTVDANRKPVVYAVGNSDQLSADEAPPQQ